MDAHDFLNPNLYLGIGETARVDDFSDKNLPFGWKDRTASQYADAETLTQRPKGDDWRSFEIEAMYRKEQQDLEHKSKNMDTCVVDDVPFGWGGRHNALSAQELMNSGSAISVAVGEVVEKDLGNTGSPSLALDRSKPVISKSSSSASSGTVNSTISSVVNTNNTKIEKNLPPVPSTIATSLTSSTMPIKSSPTDANVNMNISNTANNVKCNHQEVMTLLTKYHKEQQQVMGQLASLMIDISGRLTTLEYKLEDHINKKE